MVQLIHLILDLLGHLPVVGHEELVVELKLEDCVLRNVVVGHRLLERVDLLQQKLPDFRHRPDLKFVDDVANVVAGAGVWGGRKTIII